MNDPILVDECLSVALVAVAKARGVAALHAAHVGKGGWQDWNLVAFALENDYIIATNNRRHFLKEYMKQELHNGVLIVVPNVEREDQIRLFAAALDALAARGGDLTNHVIEVLADGSVHLREWTRETHDLGHLAQPRWPRTDP